MLIHVKVNTGAKKELFEELSDTRFEASVREKPERNEANARVLELVARRFGVSSGSIKIITGHHSPSKILEVKDKMLK